jgi:hypothetical protein
MEPGTFRPSAVFVPPSPTESPSIGGKDTATHAGSWYPGALTNLPRDSLCVARLSRRRRRGLVTRVSHWHEKRVHGRVPRAHQSATFALEPSFHQVQVPGALGFLRLCETLFREVVVAGILHLRPRGREPLKREEATTRTAFPHWFLPDLDRPFHI